MLKVVPEDFVVTEDFVVAEGLVVPDDFTVARAGWVPAFLSVTRATGASTPVRAAVVSGSAGKEADVEETEPAAIESALDAAPG